MGKIVRTLVQKRSIPDCMKSQRNSHCPSISHRNSNIFAKSTALLSDILIPSLPETYRQGDKLFVNSSFTPISSMLCKEHHRLSVVFLRACYFRVLHIYFHIIDLFYFKEAIRKICGQFIVEVREGGAMGVNLRLAVFTQQCFTLWALGMRPEPTLFSPAFPAPCFPLEEKAGTAVKSQESQSQ